jgi:hypothetical protein
MPPGYNISRSPAQIVARFLLEYYSIWDRHFPGLNKRAHWHVIFLARSSGERGVSSRAVHRTLYGSYGTDIRTCIERIKDCARDGFIRVFDDADRDCVATAGCLIGPTERLFASFEAHCRDTLEAIRAALGDAPHPYGRPVACDDHMIGEIYRFFGAYDAKWRASCEGVVRNKGLTPAHLDDAMDHLVTYQYWAIIMLLWSNAHLLERAGATPLVIDEIISRMWDRLRLGHLAIKERVANLVRWGFFVEQTVKKHKAVSLSAAAEDAVSSGLTETQPLLVELHARLVAPAPRAQPGKVA